MYDTFISLFLCALSTFFGQSVFSLITSSYAPLSSVFVFATCHRCTSFIYFSVSISRLLLLFSILLFYLLLFLSLSHQLTVFPAYSPLFVLFYLFNMLHLHWFGAFHSPFLHCNFPLLFSIFSARHLTVTLDVFHFSSFYSNLSLHSLRWCYFSSAGFRSPDPVSPILWFLAFFHFCAMLRLTYFKK